MSKLSLSCVPCYDSALAWMGEMCLSTPGSLIRATEKQYAYVRKVWNSSNTGVELRLTR